MKIVFLVLGFLGTIINIIFVINHLFEKFILKTDPYKNRLIRNSNFLSIAIGFFFSLYIIFSIYNPELTPFPFPKLGKLPSKDIYPILIYLFYSTLLLSVLVEDILPIKHRQVKTENIRAFYYKAFSTELLWVVLGSTLFIIIGGTGVLITNTLSPPWSEISLYRKLYYIYKIFVLSFVYMLIFLKSRKISLEIARLVIPIKKEPFGFVYGVDDIKQPQKKKLYNLSIILMFFYIMSLAIMFFMKLFSPGFYANGKEIFFIVEIGYFSYLFVLVYFNSIFFISNRGGKGIFLNKVYRSSFIIFLLVPYVIFPVLFKLYVTMKKTTADNKDAIIAGIIVVLVTTIIIRFLDYSLKIKNPKKK